ncbi:MAG: hypothetical protein C0425_10675 [Chlorobiaceae bacterium]|nr:hypothetical protein [Chlorobiaceae bacterium]MBA4310781.1 hypothetical protein [Chlorobiaceae bacterium]
MKNIWIIILFTLREAISRKIFLAFAIISTLAILGNYVVVTLFVRDLMRTVAGSEQYASIADFIVPYQLGVISTVAGLGIMLSIFAASSLIQTILEKGAADIFLSKPISRIELLMGRYLGGVLIVFINIVYLFVGIWGVIGLKFDYWNFEFLYIIPVLTFMFAILNSLLLFFGVLTNGSVVGMMSTYFVYIILSPILAAKDSYIEAMSGTWQNIIEVLYYIIPKTAELQNNLNAYLIFEKGSVNPQIVITSLMFMFVMLGGTILVFRKKDY